MLVLEPLAASPGLFIAVAVVLGLLVGSFLNVVIYRLPLMMERAERAYCGELLGQPAAAPEAVFNLWTPRSRCPTCAHPIGASANIPVVSYLVQGGRCRQCRTAISVQYPVVEALSGLAAGVVAWQLGFGWQAAAAMVLTWALIALSGIDLRHQLLPDSITLPFVWLGVGLALLGVFTDLRSSVIGAMIGYLALWSVYWLFKLLTGKEGMGYGDFKLLAALGAWQGWQYLFSMIIVSSLVGSLVGLTLVFWRGRDHNVPMPFGPFLAAAGWVTLLWGDQLHALYNAWMFS